MWPGKFALLSLLLCNLSAERSDEKEESPIWRYSSEEASYQKGIHLFPKGLCIQGPLGVFTGGEAQFFPVERGRGPVPSYLQLWNGVTWSYEEKGERRELLCDQIRIDLKESFAQLLSDAPEQSVQLTWWHSERANDCSPLLQIRARQMEIEGRKKREKRECFPILQNVKAEQMVTANYKEKMIIYADRLSLFHHEEREVSDQLIFSALLPKHLCHFIDHEKKIEITSQSCTASLLKQETFYQGESDLSLKSEKGTYYKLTKVFFEGDVHVLAWGVANENTSPPLRMVCADQAIFSLIEESLLLKAREGHQVTYLDEQKQCLVRAQRVDLYREKERAEERIRPQGEISVSFDPEEIEAFVSLQKEYNRSDV